MYCYIQASTEAPILADAAEQLKKLDGANSGIYHIVLPDGRLRRIEFISAPLKKVEEAKKVEQPKPAPQEQLKAPKVRQDVYHVAFDEEQQRFAEQFSRPLEHLNAPSQFKQEPQAPQQNYQQPQQFNQQPQQFNQEAQQYNQQPQESTFTTRQLYPQYVPGVIPQSQQFNAQPQPQQQFNQQFNPQPPQQQGSSSYLPPQETKNVRFPEQPAAPAQDEESKPELTKEEIKYVANIQYSNVEPIRGPIYSYNSSPLVRIIRK